jgi:DNA-binding transcriptional MerR regulator
MDSQTLVHEGHATLGSFIQTSDLADLLHTSVRSLERWRSEGRGPSYYEISGGRILYRQKDVNEWLASRRVNVNIKTVAHRLSESNQREEVTIDG